MKAVPVESGRVIRIDVDRAAMMCFRTRPIKIMRDRGEAQLTVSFSRSGIEFNGFLSGLPGCGGAFLEWFDTENAEPVVVVGNAGVGESVIGIEFDGALVAFDGSRQTRFGIGAPVITTAQIRVES